MFRLAGCLLLLWTALPVAASAQEAVAEVVAGGKALVAGDLAAAEERFAAARELAPDLAPAWLGLAEVRERQGRPDEALGLARRAAELAPEAAVVHRVTGRLLARLGAEEEALVSLARARELAPAEPESYLLAALLLRQRAAVDEAATLLEEALGAGADGADLRRELVLLHLSAGRTTEAASTAAAAVERFPDHPGLQLAMGLALSALPDRRAEAPAWLERALAGGVERPGRVRLELGAVLLDSGDADAARQQLEAAVAELPEEPAAWYRLAQARRATGDGEGAAAALARFQELGQRRDAAERAAKELGAALNEAQNLALANRLDEALVRVRAVLAASPGVPRARALEAKVLFSMGRREEALAALELARAAAPAAVEYAFLAGEFLKAMGRSEEAAAAFEQALELDPALTAAWERLGRLALAAGHAEEAVRRFERALELGADGPALRLFYSEALERAGRTAESERQMEAYRRLRNPAREPEP